MGIYVTKEQYEIACSASLPSYLLLHHGDKVHLEYDSVILNTNNSVSVKNEIGWHGYIDWKTGETGNNIDYLMKYLGYDYPTSVSMLCEFLGNHAISPTAGIRSCKTPRIETRRKDIVFPEQEIGQYKRAFAYLTSRGIDANLIKDLINKGILYQDINGNLVFITPERDFAEIRGTNTFADSRCKNAGTCLEFIKGDHCWCKKMEECMNYKKNSFHSSRKIDAKRFWYYKSESSKTKVAYICEAAIDAISLYQIHKANNMPTDESVFISINGVSNQQAIERISKHIKSIIAVDNDRAGEECRNRNKNLDSITPVSKDWNEDLMKGLIYGKEQQHNQQ